MELYIIRHAQSVNNALADQRDRVADPPLTETGWRQVDLLARHLATETDTADIPHMTTVYGLKNGHSGPGYGITRLYCSPMLRALQTAQPIAKALGLTPEVWVDIHENGGIFLDGKDGPVGFGGKTRAEMEAEFPGYVVPESVTDTGWWKGAFEDYPARQYRAVTVAAQLRRWANSDERIALVTHGGFLNGLLKALFNIPTGWMSFFHQYNTAISRIELRTDGRLSVIYLNRTDFLHAQLLT
jgi:2,3-bisphosphoglycerate-dependent phosphoglycerate mutase